jgi:hypothetical protein
MKIITMLTVAGAVAGAAIPVATAQAAGNGPATPSSQSQCRSERTGMGTEAFKALYGTNADRSNAFGKCVSKRNAATVKAAKAAKVSAQKECTTEQAADAAAFTAKYGTGKKGANAFGNCVSGKARTIKAATVKAQVKADINAARTCKAAKKADAAAFATTWGSAKNAFGKCVSATAKQS